VLRSVGLINFFAECFLVFGVNLDVVPRLSQILRTVAVVNLVPEQVSKFCIVDWVLCLYLDFFSVSQVLVLHILILCFWFLDLSARFSGICWLVAVVVARQVVTVDAVVRLTYRAIRVILPEVFRQALMLDLFFPPSIHDKFKTHKMGNYLRWGIGTSCILVLKHEYVFSFHLT
jgi:hypothetical protein